jgi:transcriptional regulator with XRE-family HTH domain
VPTLAGRVHIYYRYAYDFIVTRAAPSVTRMSPIALRIRELREAQGISQRELADRARVHQPNLSRLEAGIATRVDLATLERIANALGVDASLLVRHERGAATPEPRRGRRTRKPHD